MDQSLVEIHSLVPAIGTWITLLFFRDLLCMLLAALEAARIVVPNI